MSDTLVQARVRLIEQGYAMLEGIFDIAEMDSLADRLSVTLQARDVPSILRSHGQAYGSRNLLEVFPEVSALLSRAALRGFIAANLGPDAGIVRVLYFDKPPNRSWSLPWHKDRTIAVKRNDLPGERFRKPTFKAGVPHVEAPTSLMENMLSLRIHLDAMGEANGPLYGIPASHRGDDHGQQPPVELHAKIGDVLAMRPLLTHSSGMSRPGTTLHRRVIHFEVASNAELPDGYEWYSFVRLH